MSSIINCTSSNLKISQFLVPVLISIISSRTQILHIVASEILLYQLSLLCFTALLVEPYRELILLQLLLKTEKGLANAILTACLDKL